VSFGDELDQGVDDQISEAGETLSLSRQGYRSSPVSGLVLQPGLSAKSGEVTTSATDTEIVIRREDYSPTGSPTEPKIGDRITLAESGEIWEVSRTDAGSHWTWYGGRRYAYLVRVTKLPEGSR
jgi:hypothetical protein